MNEKINKEEEVTEIIRLANDKLTPAEFTECLNAALSKLEEYEQNYVLRSCEKLGFFTKNNNHGNGKTGLGPASQLEVIGKLGMWMTTRKSVCF